MLLGCAWAALWQVGMHVLGGLKLCTYPCIA